MKFLLIRHGETDWNIEKRIQGSTDIPLNQNGRAQAEALAETLSHRSTPVSALYSSPLSRAKQTAEIIADKLCLPCQCIDGLREIGFGLWEGLRWEEVKSRFPQEYGTWYKNRRDTRPNKGESYLDLLKRLVPTLKDLVPNREENGDLVIVTHSACIMSFLSLLNNTPLHEMAKRYPLSNTAIVEIDAKQVLHCNP
ncbi:MAG: histidine phosphatase family protein [Lachnospiraceae bacterium]|nr:histidine phosphatase family protein [Lachnospiraceae bacterium]